jgi:hypothetical protein
LRGHGAQRFLFFSDESLPVQLLLRSAGEVLMKPKHDSKQDETTDNDHQKTVSGKNQRGPADKIGKNAGGAYGSRGQNRRSAGSAQGAASVGSHKPGGDGPGTKKFKHESDNIKRSTGRR